MSPFMVDVDYRYDYLFFVDSEEDSVRSTRYSADIVPRLLMDGTGA